jgi:hypothetical protein
MRWSACSLAAWALLLAAETNHVTAANAKFDLSTLQSIDVQPERLQLRSPREQAIVLVTGHFLNGLVVDLTREASITAATPEVAEVREGTVIPTGNGACDVTIIVGGKQATIPVKVAGFEKPSPISFRTETVAALTRQGCNAGSCHGAPSGKGGFQLSLQAYDHALDELTLTKGDRGRRANTIDPAQSLLLLKPTMAVAHRGGLQLKTTDYAYDVLRQWIAEGAGVDPAEGTRCVRLELVPTSGRVLKQPHLRQQIVARAHFDNGAVRDVTRLARFSSSDEQVASVSEDGVLIGHRRGQVAVMARYLDQLVSCQFTLVEEIEGFQWQDPPANNFVDELVYDKLRQLQYAPAELCSDNEFLRRVYLDVIGVLPTLTEQDAFLSDKLSDRRQRLIDKLLDRPEHARFWAMKWGDLLRLQKGEMAELGVHKFYQWLVDAFEKNKPFDQFARELLTAQGSTYENPVANYVRALDDPAEAAETTAQVFLGSRIQCAKCHNHPFENWTQDNFYGLTAFFNRMNRKPGMRIDEEVIYEARDGEVVQPRTGQVMKPWAPGGGALDELATTDRRQAFANWLTAAGNPFFARIAVNRVWAEVMGRGIVDPVDDFRQSNPPSNPALLDRLAEDFVQRGFDHQQLLRTILNSRTYQFSSQSTPLNQDDSRFFSHAKVRMLSAEQLLDAISQVTEIKEPFAGLPADTPATALPSPDFKHEFLDTFGRPARLTACACERNTNSTLAQVIQLFNGPTLQKKLLDKQNRFHRLLDQGAPLGVVIDQLYRAALCRPPTDAELQAASAHVASKPTPAEGLEDVTWALLNTEEFLTQH